MVENGISSALIESVDGIVDQSQTVRPASFVFGAINHIVEVLQIKVDISKSLSRIIGKAISGA